MVESSDSDSYSFEEDEKELHFRGWKERLIELIGKHQVIIAAVAWLQDPDILEALKDKECLLLIGGSSKEAEKLCSKYDTIKPFDCKKSVGTGLEDVNRSETLPLAAFLGVGSRKTSGSDWVFCTREADDRVISKMVMTGSPDCTLQSPRNFENMVVMKGGGAAQAFLCQFRKVLLDIEHQ